MIIRTTIRMKPQGPPNVLVPLISIPVWVLLLFATLYVGVFAILLWPAVGPKIVVICGAILMWIWAAILWVAWK